MNGGQLRRGLMRALGTRRSTARRYTLLLLLGLVFNIGPGNVVSRGPKPPIGIFSPPPKHRIPININIPGALYYLFHLRSCAADADGGSRGGEHGGHTSHQEDVVSKGLCSIVRMCARVVQFGLTVGYWFGTRPGPGVLLVAIFTLIRSSWLSKGAACLTLGAALLNLHRPLRQCRALSGLAVSCMTWGWSSRLLRLLVLAWALYQPLFTAGGPSQAEPMDLDPDPSPHPPNPPQPRDQITEEEFRSLFGLDISTEELLRREQGSNHHTCPIVGCCRHARGTRPGWNTVAGLRAHVDQHLSGELPGRPPEQWFREHRLACCRVCGLSVSTRIQGQIHPRCYTQYDQQHRPPYDGNGRYHDTTQLPNLHTIFCANIRTKEHLPKSLLPLIRTGYGKLLAAVNEASRPDAWDYLPVEQGGRGVHDTEACQAARKAWLELFLFPKCVLRQFRRGQWPQQSYHFTKSLLIRWRLGERQGLWDEAIQATAKKPQAHKPPSTAEAWGKRATEAERLAGLGRAAQAIHRLGSPGLAYNTPMVRQKLFGKFPPVHVGFPSPLGLEMPPAPHIPIEQVIKAIKSFAPGVGPGPDGLRADYLKQIMGPDDDNTIIPLYRDFV